MGVWGEFENKVKFASYRPTPEGFLEQIKSKMGIDKIRQPEIIELLTKENIDILRKEPTKIILILRSLTDTKKRKKAEFEKTINAKVEKKAFNVSLNDLFGEIEKESTNEIVDKTEEEIDKEFAEIFGLTI